MNAPTVIPITITDYTMRQSSCEVVGTLPIRSIILGARGSGKTVLLQNITLEIFKGCFERIYTFSPWIDVDSSGYLGQQTLMAWNQHTNEELLLHNKMIENMAHWRINELEHITYSTAYILKFKKHRIKNSCGSLSINAHVKVQAWKDLVM